MKRTFNSSYRPLSLFIVLGSFLCQGCVAIFKGNVQNDVMVTTEEDPDTEIKVRKDRTDELETDSSKGKLRTDLSRKHYLYPVILSKEGYLDVHRVLHKDHLSGGTFFLLALGVFPGFSLPYNWDGRNYYYKVRDFPPENRFEAPSYRIPEGGRFQKELMLRGIDWELEEGDTLYQVYHGPSSFNGRISPERVLTYKQLGSMEEKKPYSREGVSFLKEGFKELLMGSEFLDSNESSMVLNDHNSYRLHAEIVDFDAHFFPVHFHRWVKTGYGFNDNDVWGGELFDVDLNVRWEMKNNFGEVVFDTVTSGYSGEFCYQYIPEKAPEHSNFVANSNSVQRSKPEAHEKKSASVQQRKLHRAMLRALKASWIASMEAPKMQRSLLKDTEKEMEEKYAELDPIELERPKKEDPSDGLEKQVKGVVTVDRKEGHGSGCIISADGYILTNYHVIKDQEEGGSDSVEVIFHDDSKMMAERVRTNRMSDLALLKVDTTGLPALRIKKEGEPRLGAYVYAIGTPKSRSLAQTVTKGVVSGHRKFNGVRYIQADVSISPGNSGGALIEKGSGELVGVPSVKFIGSEVEGLGFSVSGRSIMEGLKLRYEKE